MGQTLHTTRAEIYRALIEATAFGARAIIERLREYGVPVERVVCAGGIAEKNPMLMQIYADITGCTMQVAGSSQACALGSAISAAVLAGAHPDFHAAQKAMSSLKPTVTVRARTARASTTNFTRSTGRSTTPSAGSTNPLTSPTVMKDLIRLKEQAHGQPENSDLAATEPAPLKTSPADAL